MTHQPSWLIRRRLDSSKIPPEEVPLNQRKVPQHSGILTNVCSPTCRKANSLEDFFPTLSSRPRWGFFSSPLAAATPPHLPSRADPWPLPSLSSPGPSATADSGKNQQSALGAVPLFCEAAQLLTVFFALPCKCAGIKAGVMGRRLCGGLFPKPTAAPYNGQGVPWSSSFFCGRCRKIMTESFFCRLAAASVPLCWDS